MGSTVKTWSTSPPISPIIDNGTINYVSGNVLEIIYGDIEAIAPNHDYGLFIVAEDPADPDVFSTVHRFNVTTPTCAIPNFLSGLSQPIVCVNLGATANYGIAIISPPDISGIWKDTEWTLDWGDGTIPTTYISTSDNDYPSAAQRTHTYVKGSDCNYIFSCTVTNPCGQTFIDYKIALAHGRDTVSDGDGYLKLIDQATGLTTIEVCEGVSTTVTIQDNSNWDCQSPSLPVGFTPVPNSETRNIEWLYGVDPVTGLPDFSISGGGLVNIATLGDAPQQSERFTPTPYGSSSLSQTITIPATCMAGDYFRVYLKNWNKCNPLNAEYVSTFITINIIAAPAAPIAPDKSVCFGSDRTLEVTSIPVGEIDWFSDAALTTMVAPNTITYLPPETDVGTYYKWVTDRSTSGLGCRSEATMVELVINPIPATPAISFSSSSGSLVICSEPPVEYVTLNASAVA